MTNDAAWLRAMSKVLRRMALERADRGDVPGVELATELRGLAMFVDAAALMVEDDDTFRAEAATAPAREVTRIGVIATNRGT